MSETQKFKELLLGFGSFIYGFAMHSAREVFVEEFRDNGKIPQGVNLYLAVIKRMREIIKRHNDV